jgi:hypothetical protein
MSTSPAIADTESPASRPHSTPAAPRWKCATNTIDNVVTSAVCTKFRAMYLTGWNVTRRTSFENITISVNGSVTAPIPTSSRPPPPSRPTAIGPEKAMNTAEARLEASNRNASELDTMRTRVARSGCS